MDVELVEGYDFRGYDFVDGWRIGDTFLLSWQRSQKRRYQWYRGSMTLSSETELQTPTFSMRMI